MGTQQLSLAFLSGPLWSLQFFAREFLCVAVARCLHQRQP